jgi:toxin ParE1/3/4
MSSYSFADRAVRDLEEICEYIGKNDKGAASQLFDDIRQKCKLVAGFPSLGKSYENLALGLRGFIVDNYIVLYYPRESGIDVARVINGSRDLEELF